MLGFGKWRQARRFAKLDRETKAYWRPSDKGGRCYLCPSCAELSPISLAAGFAVSRAEMREVPFYLAACRDCHRPL